MANVPNEHSLSTLLDGLKDVDVEETQEWTESLEDLIKTHGTERAEYILRSLIQEAGKKGVEVPVLTKTDYINTIAVDQQPEYPGDADLEEQYRNWIRWNAAIMVQRAQKQGIGVGGHISTYAGIADLMKLGSTTSSADAITPAAVTRYSSRATPLPVTMRALSLRAASAKRTWMASVRRRPRASMAFLLTRTPGACLSSGSSPQYRWV